MSTLLPADAPPESLAPITHSGLLAYFHDGAKARFDWRLGAEFEQFAVDRRTGRPLPYAGPGGIRSILQTLADRFGWEPCHEGDALTALTRDGACVSLEPGGQVEFSTSPTSTLAELHAEYDRYLREIREAFDPSIVAWVPAGVIPSCAVEDIPLGVRRRHAVMAEYLPPRGPMALHMMKATASTQAAFDYSDEADAMAKFDVALRLGPVVNAIWANSPAYGGAATEWVSYRGRIWQGMDPDRSGLLVPLLERGLSFRAWTDYLLDVPMLFHACHGDFEPAGGRTFRQFLSKGIAGHFPTKADWELHLTTVFPEVRLKHFLEVRGADANPPALALAVPALWKGLLYDALDDAGELAQRFAPGELCEVADAAHRHGLKAKHGKRTLLEEARDVVAVAEAGLPPDERRFLEPVKEILERGTSPASAWHGRKSKPMIEHFEA